MSITAQAVALTAAPATISQSHPSAGTAASTVAVASTLSPPAATPDIISRPHAETSACIARGRRTRDKTSTATHAAATGNASNFAATTASYPASAHQGRCAMAQHNNPAHATAKKIMNRSTRNSLLSCRWY